MKIFFTSLLITLSIIVFGQSSVTKKNVDSVVSNLSIDEKLSMIVGYKNFNIHGVEKLEIPPVLMADGPMGVKGHGKATAFPASICMAASWNPELIHNVGSAIGLEAKSKNIGILLAPGVNIYRVPHCGRNFEYYGEDPFLVSEMAVQFISGVQKQGVMSTIKHFVANNQDYDRHRVSSNIDERTLHEIYFPAFKAAIQRADVGAVMTSYNPLNGIHTSESKYLMKDILRDKWNFDGIIISDWISVYSTRAFKAGLDLEMPRAQYMHKDSVFPFIESDKESKIELDKKVKNIISTCLKYDLYKQNKEPEPDWDKHNDIALQVAREGIVLLKNEDEILPLRQKQKIAVLGSNALYTPYSGGGAAMVDAYKMISVYEGVKKQCPNNTKVDYISIEGIDRLHAKVHEKDFLNRLNVLKEYDAVIVCVGFNSKTEGEAFDRPFSLPKDQNWLIRKISEINPNIIVTINSGGGIAMPWINNIKALLFAWYGGQETGTAVGEILFGKVSPSGKLPISIEKRWKDNAAYENYDSSYAVPGAKPFYTLYGKPHKNIDLDYKEGLFIGYRHFEKNNIKPMFPFGFGLSYTSFKLDDFECDDISISGNETGTIKLRISNEGDIAGAEVIQLYIQDKVASLPRPMKELKAFKKVILKPGESKNIEFTISKDMLKFYHPEKQGWLAEYGEFDILIGTSSDNIIFKETISYKEK